MSSTPAGYELQFNDDIPHYLKPKPLYGNIVDVSLTTYKCTIVTWPPPHRSRKGHKISTYTFMLNELPHTQASGMLKNALVAWVNKARAAEFEHEVGTVNDNHSHQNRNKKESSRSTTSPSTPKHSHSHSRNTSRSSSSDSPTREGAGSGSRLSPKEQRKLLLGPRVTFLDEEEVMAPPPLPPKDSKYSTTSAHLHSPSRLSPANSPVKRKHYTLHHHHHQRRKSSDLAHEGHAVDIGLVWWEAEMHGQRV